MRGDCWNYSIGHYCLSFTVSRKWEVVVLETIKSSYKTNHLRGSHCRDRMVVGFTTSYAISATDAVSSNLDQDDVYNIM